MAMVQCTECKADISSDARVCPSCGKQRPTGSTVGQVLVSIVVMIGLFWFFFGGGLQKQADSSLQDIKDKVAGDAVAQYNIASSQGDKMQKCVQAGLVSAAYLQAQDQSNYDIWKATERVDCTVAGLPR